MWTRVVSRLHGEIPADTLEAYRRASLPVHDLLHQAEQARATAQLEGKSAWAVAANVQAEMLCAWNAFVLQSLGNEFLDADYHDNPKTKGYVPPITAGQVMAFYSEVEAWLNRAQQATSNPDYRLDVRVPANLPPWSEVEPCPNSHLHGMLNAMRAIRDHAAGAMNFLRSAQVSDPDQQAQMNRIQQLDAAANTKARYAEDLHGGAPSREMHERVEPHIKESIEHFYKLGQWIAMPSLAVDRRGSGTRGPAAATGVLALPGEPGFDPWCMTDPRSVAEWQRDPEARRAIQQLWEADPDPRLTLGIQNEILQAERGEEIRPALGAGGVPLGHFFCCPWQTIYEVLEPVTIGGRRLSPRQQFVFDVSAEGTRLGVPFKREISVGRFASTDRAEYGNPDEPPDH